MATILIVDDTLIMRKAIRDIVEEAGHEVVGEAENGREAFEKYKELKPDLVTMDITMPRSDGIEGLELIIDFDSRAKVLMCSALGQKAFIVKALQLGAANFIVKPFKKETVLQNINKIFSSF